MSLFAKKTSFDSSKCVSLLDLTLQRIKILRNKKLIIAKQSRDDVAKLLQKGQDENAASRVEHVFRENNIAGAYDLLEQYCQLIIKRISIIKSGKECPPELKEAIASLIYAAPRCGDLQELQKLRDLLTSKCGDEYSSAVLEQRPEGSVNQQIIQKLSGRPPNSDTRLVLLKEIAREYKIAWNYQKAEASLKKGEASIQDKQKVKSLDQVLKHADVDKEKPPAPAPLRREEQVTTAAHDVIPSQSVNTRSETGEATDVALHGDGWYKNHASAAAQSSRRSITHSGSPKPTEFVGASKKPIVGSPNTTEKERPHDVPKHQIDVPKHQVSSRDKESLQAYVDTVPSRPLSRQKEHMGANPISGPGLHAGPTKEKVSLINAPQDELQGQQRLVNPTQNLNSHYEEKGFVSPSRMGVAKPSSVVERDNSEVPHTTALRPKSSVNSTQASDGRIQESPERTELSRLKEHTASIGGFHHAKVLLPKPLPHSISDRETNNNIEESLAARQYMRAHKSYMKTDAGGGEDDLKHMENSGTNVRAKHGTALSHVDPYARLRQEGRMDYKSGRGQAQEHRTPQSIDKEEDKTPHEYYDREQPKATHHYGGEQRKGTHSQRGSNGFSHEDSSSSNMSEERIWRRKNDYSVQARRPAEEIHHRNPSTSPELVKRHAARPLGPSKRDKELAELEASAETACVSAAHAAEAARAAIDMVRSNSMRSKKVGDMEEREPYMKTSFNSTVRGGLPVTHAEMLGIDSEVENEQDKQEIKSRYRQAYQEEEPSFNDSEKPHFDDYSSYESSEEEAWFYTKRSAASARKDDAQENKTGAANKHNQSVSPFVRDTLGSRPQSDDRYAQSDNGIGWTSAAPKKSYASGGLNTSKLKPSGAAMTTDNGGRQGRISATNEHVINNSWGTSVPDRPATTDFSKQRWNLTADNAVDTQPPVPAHIKASLRDHPTQDSQAQVGKYVGVSRRSVRSTRLP